MRSPRDLLVGFPPLPALWQVSGRPGWGAEGAESRDRASEGEGWGPGSARRHSGFFGDHGTVVGGSGRATGQCLPSAPHGASPADQEEVKGGAREQGGSGRNASGSSAAPSPAHVSSPEASLTTCSKLWMFQIPTEFPPCFLATPPYSVTAVSPWLWPCRGPGARGPSCPRHWPQGPLGDRHAGCPKGGRASSRQALIVRLLFPPHSKPRGCFTFTFTGCEWS